MTDQGSLLLSPVVGSTVGEWASKGAERSEAGTYAVIIGVSDYAATNRVPKLASSAFTAARFFKWLACRERSRKAPLKRCWLLLSPTRIETGEDGGTDYLDVQTGLYGPATFDAIDTAVGQWYEAMAAIQPGSASRAIFYFCGHGVEHVPGHQVLLPSDYLAPSKPNRNRAVATPNLVAALSNLNVETQFFYFDACRNSGDLRGIVPPTGYELLETPTESRQRQAIMVSATIGGSVTAQHAHPSNGGSFFGDALHDALTANMECNPTFEPDCSSKPCTVKLYPLHGFLNSRVGRLMSYAPGTRVVNIGGQITDLDTVVAEVPDHAPLALDMSGISRLRSADTSLPGGDFLHGLSFAFDGGSEGTAGPLSVTQDLSDILDEGNQNVRDLEKLHGISCDVGRALRTSLPEHFDYSAACSILGHEYYGEFFGLIEQRWSADTRTWQQITSPVLALELEQRDNGIVFRFRTTVNDPGFIWLALGNQGGAQACFLLPNVRIPTYYERAQTPTDYELQTTWQGPELLDASLNLALSNEGLLGTAATLWVRYKNLSAFKDVGSLPIETLGERTLRDKYSEPLAATIALLILLRAGRFDRIHDWDHNLVSIASSDGAIFALERLLRDPSVFSNKNAGTYLDLITQKGLPVLSEAYSSLLTSAELLRAPATKHQKRIASTEVVDKCARLMHSLEGVFARFRSGNGLFASFDQTQPVYWHSP